MIGALLLTGGCGVLAVLTGTWDVVGRVMLSSTVAAIAAGMMMPIAGWIDDEDTRASGLWGIALIVLQFLFFISAIWIDYSDVQWRLLATGFILFPVGWPAIWIVLAKANKPFTLAKTTALLTLCISAAAFVAGIWWPKVSTILNALDPSNDGDWKLISSGSVLYFYGLLAAIALSNWTRNDTRHWRWLGPLGAIVSITLCLTGIWMGSHERTPILDVATALALFCAHAVFLLNLSLGISPAARLLRLSTILISAITMAMACAVSITNINDRWSQIDTPLTRLTGAGTILTLCATLSLIITARLTRGINIAPTDALVMGSLIDLFCPRCKTRQSLPAGDSACNHCDLRISIKIQEPRCTHCGYMLHKLATPFCPECGQPVTQPAST